MGSLFIWTFIVILYQTAFCMIISWLTLSCQLMPDPSELYEVTLAKMLYLYDPVACERVVTYNTTFIGATSEFWPIKNIIAARFRKKLKVWLGLHIAWMVIYLVYLLQRQRPHGFLLGLIPFTIVGVTMLIVDLVNCGAFLTDATLTQSEVDIIKYINSVEGNVQYKIVENYDITSIPPSQNTSWVALVLAYCSCRGIVQWIINFWIIKDNFVVGRAHFNQLQAASNKFARKTSSY